MTQSINELKSYTEYNVSTPTSVFTIGFQYEYNVDHVNVYVDGVEATAAGYSVQYDSQGTVQLTPAVPSGVVLLQRETNIDGMVHTFSAGAKFTADNMDEDFKQLRHAQQEVRDETARTAEQFAILDANATAALQAATTAANTANSVDAKASTALANSNTAVSTANSANSTANTALSTANGIDAKATTALSDSSTALSTANSALGTANGIDAKATQAQQDASTALSTVSTQKGAANGIVPLDANTKIDPIYLPQATETALGVAKIATIAIAQAGVNDTDFITAKKLNSVLNDQVFGVGQTWMNVKSERSLGTTYTNTTGKPIYVIVVNEFQNSYDLVEVFVNNIKLMSVDKGSGIGWFGDTSFVVPAGQTYKVTKEVYPNIQSWVELR